MAFISLLARLRISPKTIWIITKRLMPISTPKRGCSRGFCPRRISGHQHRRSQSAVLVDVALSRGQDVITLGTGQGDLQILGIRFDATGQEVRFSWRGEVNTARLNLIGGFQAQNVLTAAALAIACGAQSAEVFRCLPELRTVPGRMQLAATRKNGASVFVDYAHTPDALETALKAMRPHVLGRLLVVFGAGGDRDKESGL